MGIGSEGYVALELGRKFIGAELKDSYFRQAVANLDSAQRQTNDLSPRLHDGLSQLRICQTGVVASAGLTGDIALPEPMFPHQPH